MSLKIDGCDNGFVLTDDDKESSSGISKSVYVCNHSEDLEGVLDMLCEILRWTGYYQFDRSKKRISIEIKNEGKDKNEKEELDCRSNEE